MESIKLRLSAVYHYLLRRLPSESFRVVGGHHRSTSLLPHVTVNTPCCQKQKLNHWPQSNYTSRPSWLPLCVFTPVSISCVGIVSNTRAFCHHPAGLIKVSQSYMVMQRSSTRQDAADRDSQRCCSLYLFTCLPDCKRFGHILRFLLRVLCGSEESIEVTGGWFWKATFYLVYFNTWDK